MITDLRTLSTERMICEALGPKHHEEIQSLLNDPRVARTLAIDGLPPAKGATIAELQVKATHWDEHGFGLWLLRDRATGAMVGRGGLQTTVVDGTVEIEIAWAIVPERWREGLATELAQACVRVAFDELELDEVIAYTLPDNVASRRVMDKAGLTFEREIVAAGRPHVLYRRRRW